MKWIFILLLGLIIIVQPAFGVLLGEKTGLKFSSSVNVDGTVFVIEGTGNFDVKDISFDQADFAPPLAAGNCTISVICHEVVIAVSQREGAVAKSRLSMC